MQGLEKHCLLTDLLHVIHSVRLRTQAHLLRNGTTRCGLSPSTSLLNQENVPIGFLPDQSDEAVLSEISSFQILLSS